MQVLTGLRRQMTDLRQYLYDMRKRFFGKKRKRRPIPITLGLPESLPEETLIALSREHFHGAPRAFRQQHLSGWKSSGAYRIFMDFADGREVRLIFKTAIYNPEDIPALSGLPVQPGPAEYAILSHASGPLASYLPCVYLAEEVTPGTRYHYILEDLGLEYHRAIGEERIRAAATLYPAFHDAMARWDPRDDAGLIQYGREFSTALQAYALPRLEQFAAQQDAPAVRDLLVNWNAVTQAHLDSEFFDNVPRVLIHGDPNYSNVYLRNDDPRKMKLVDWEWAGVGMPFADLVSLLKGAPQHLERWAVDHFVEHANRMPGGDRMMAARAHRLYAWSHLERGLLDAAFLSVQALTTEHQTRFSLHSAVSSAARRAMRAHRQLI